MTDVIAMKQKDKNKNTNIIENLNSFFNLSNTKEIVRLSGVPLATRDEDGDEVLSVDITIDNSIEESE